MKLPKIFRKKKPRGQKGAVDDVDLGVVESAKDDPGLEKVFRDALREPLSHEPGIVTPAFNFQKMFEYELLSAESIPAKTFEERCRRQGLNPKTASVFELECAERGNDPGEVLSSLFKDE